MKRLEARLAQLAQVEQRRRVRRIAASLGDRFRGVHLEILNDGVAVRGRGLMRRWLTDPALRFLGWSGS